MRTLAIKPSFALLPVRFPFSVSGGRLCGRPGVFFWLVSILIRPLAPRRASGAAQAGGSRSSIDGRMIPPGLSRFFPLGVQSVRLRWPLLSMIVRPFWVLEALHNEALHNESFLIPVRCAKFLEIYGHCPRERRLALLFFREISRPSPVCCRAERLGCVLSLSPAHGPLV